MEDRKDQRHKGRVGRSGEDLVCEHLIALGHTVIERNWRSGHLEVDIITLDKAGLHFVEVKSRCAPVQADPEVNVGRVKQRKIVAAALSYLRQKPVPDVECFFDVATVVFDGDGAEVKYYPQAYVPIYV